MSDHLPEDLTKDHHGPARARRGLLALGSAAVLAVYSAGYVRTRAAAERFAIESERHPGPTRASHVDATNVPMSPIAHASTEAAVAAAAKAAPTRAPGAVRAAEGGDLSASASHGRTSGDGNRAPNGVANLAASANSSTKSEVSASPTVVTAESTTASTPVAPAPGEVTVADSTNSTQAADSTASDSANAVLPYKDGIYSGWGTSRHGDIEASVEIRGGRIIAATITQCLTRYSCAWIERLPYQVVSRQSAEVDYVSGATQSTNAFYYAIIEALSKAK